MRKRKAYLVFISFGIELLMVGAVAGAPTTSSAPTEAGKRVPTGWIHVQVKDLAGGEITEGEVEGGKKVKAPEGYFNKAQLAKCDISGYEGSVEIRFLSVKSGEMAQYDQRQGMVALGTMHPLLMEKTRKDIEEFPLTLEEMMESLKKRGAIIVRFVQRMEGGLERSEISYVPGKECKTCPDEGGCDVVWVDPKTKWIQKIQPQLDQPQEVTYTYYKRDFRSIYDFGVPQGVRVMDCRPSPEAKAVLDRLDGRLEKDLGTYVAVMTETDHRKEWGSRKMFLHLYSRDGARLAYIIYGFREREYPDSPMFGIQGWPKPKIADVMALAEKTVPMFYFSTDGKTVWTGTFDEINTKPAHIKEHEQLFKDHPPVPAYCLPSNLWKGREELFLYGYGPKADTVKDPSRPGVIGLRLREGDFSEEAKGLQRTEKVFWIDPARNDVPVETVVDSRKYGKGGVVTRTQFLTNYDQYARLDDGTWYPVHWERKASQEQLSPNSKPADSSAVTLSHGRQGGYSREFHLQIVPKMTLSPTWYGNRTTALKATEAAGVSTSPKR